MWGTQMINYLCDRRLSEPSEVSQSFRKSRLCCENLWSFCCKVAPTCKSSQVSIFFSFSRLEQKDGMTDKLHSGSTYPRSSVLTEAASQTNFFLHFHFDQSLLASLCPQAFSLKPAWCSLDPPLFFLQKKGKQKEKQVNCAHTHKKK